ncbi:facilitated glucose transporter [Gordonia bronchialis DSM 43247]|uniref:Facilitated glucose transporter n=1 Tax=Gordonia bronchialis (strain ATCC 25592 / DSM 43247 / BCRC 13721 / JCM 3198 / KCTC 3076 / NBRC 16047 / NCTC 10667) TaxID=526226 RepID=D0LD39_GORB4|nr:hypothetical protein [Gordonia bronchialis]ACY22532.1 facilitated glucose transporter [Gordonia bronchialis DSM 43247]MCC3325317.1 facilitated glucose transporter [Gordonia bronchialis]UAK39855.1 facilitated glucose transporter [Gordonia bronchialis]STQ65461.1 Uncharacterised protein [Gordonia bronchialis]
MRPIDRIMLALLVVDGVVIGVLSLSFAYLRFGGVAVPVAAVLAGLANCVLLWLAAGYTASAWRFAPLAGWVLGVFVGAVPGPGGDVLLASDTGLAIPTMLLLLLGGGLPAALIWSGRLPAGDRARSPRR